MNYAEDSRIDEFCRELALVLRRITGHAQETLREDLPHKTDLSPFASETITESKEKGKEK
jgi:hypothetical protein